MQLDAIEARIDRVARRFSKIPNHLFYVIYGHLARYRCRRFSELIVSLKSMPDVDGRTILDNTLIFQGTDISDGDAHNHNDMPVVLAGGVGGFKMGQHLDFSVAGNVIGNGAQLAPPANAAGHWYSELFVTIAQAFGVNISTFGQNGNAPLTGLT